MKKYYTRACNFTHGKKSVNLVKKKINLPLRGNNKISFNEIEIISRNSKKTIQIKDWKSKKITIEKEPTIFIFHSGLIIF